MDPVTPGTKRLVDGCWRVFYDGYWIKAYETPADTLLAKKRLIEALTRRLFNHVEHGVNVPGIRMDEARRAYEGETCPRRKRVKGAMLAGALFNRAADIFTKLVEIQALGVVIQPNNALMRDCGEHLQEALQLGRLVLHRSGEEGIDEMWGEPFKAFAFPIEEFYRSRYVKIAMTMAAIDRISAELVGTFAPLRAYAGIDAPIAEFAQAAKAKCETLRTDPEIFEVWTSLVVAAERLMEFKVTVSEHASASEQQWAVEGADLIREARDLIYHVVRARVPMPKTTRKFAERCARYRTLPAAPGARRALSPAPDSTTAAPPGG